MRRAQRTRQARADALQPITSSSKRPIAYSTRQSDVHHAESHVKSVKVRVQLTIYLVSAHMFSVAHAVAPTPRPLEQASNAALVAHLIDREIGSWKALQQHDKQAWESQLADTYSQVNSRGIRTNRAEVLNMFGNEVVEGYSLHDMRGTLLCPDVVLVAYWIERTSKSTGAFTSNSIWVKRTGNWLRLQYQETPMSPQPSISGRRDSFTTAQP